MLEQGEAYIHQVFLVTKVLVSHDNDMMVHEMH